MKWKNTNQITIKQDKITNKNNNKIKYNGMKIKIKMKS